MGVFEEIAESAEALTDTHPHAEPRWGRDIHRNRIPLPPHKTTVPGLIQQLRDAIEPGAGGGESGGKPAGSEPGDISAISLLASIEHGSRWRALQWGVTGDRTAAEDFIRGLVGAASKRSHDEQMELRVELRAWQRQAEIITGWRTASRPLNAPCLVCEAKGSLLARVDDEQPSAVCIACGERWEGDEVGLLARHVIEYQNRTHEQRQASRARSVADRRRREGKVSVAA